MRLAAEPSLAESSVITEQKELQQHFSIPRLPRVHGFCTFSYKSTRICPSLHSFLFLGSSVKNGAAEQHPRRGRFPQTQALGSGGWNWMIFKGLSNPNHPINTNPGPNPANSIALMWELIYNFHFDLGCPSCSVIPHTHPLEPPPFPEHERSSGEGVLQSPGLVESLSA